MSYAAPIVFVLDDNLSVGKSLKLLILNVDRRPVLDVAWVHGPLRRCRSTGMQRIRIHCVSRF
jgi:hypothetical protein